MKVIVIKPNLKYRVPELNKGRSFMPKVGQIIDLPIPIVKKELKSRNVRRPLEEEITEIKAKKEKKLKRTIVADE